LRIKKILTSENLFVA